MIVAVATVLAQPVAISLTGHQAGARVEEKIAADRIELSTEQIARLNSLTPAAGDRHDEGNMAVIDR
ncbi:MAG TPA: hypothetical protein VII35_02925 [Steroidobacteraceae bacterium]